MTKKETHSAVAAFIVAERKKLKNYINQRMYSYEVDAEDIIQDVALNVFLRIDFESPIRNIGAFIYRSIRNRIIDISRKKNNQVLYEDFSDEQEENIILKTAKDDSLPSEELEEKKIQVEKLYEALYKLNPMQREIIIATDFEDRTFEQLSNEWKIPIGTLLARKHRAMAKLQEIYFNNNIKQ